NIGPADTPVTRAILRADAELKQVAPNLTFIYDAEITPDDLLLLAKYATLFADGCRIE
ncbi:DUF3029 family protein, partial [Salmonella enterica subsp. enterica serovar Virginia]|nr:DUF3029 family protein [Salmonella enterica subsp. enterica serovar Virginia]